MNQKHETELRIPYRNLAWVNIFLALCLTINLKTMILSPDWDKAHMTSSFSRVIWFYMNTEGHSMGRGFMESG